MGTSLRKISGREIISPTWVKQRWQTVFFSGWTHRLATCVLSAAQPTRSPASLIRPSSAFLLPYSFELRFRKTRSARDPASAQSSTRREHCMPIHEVAGMRASVTPCDSAHVALIGANTFAKQDSERH